MTPMTATRYVCPHCGVPRKTATICPECATRLVAEEKAKQVERERQKRTARARRAVSASSMGKLLEDASFDKWEHRPELAKLYTDCRDYAKEWPKRKAQGKGLVLAGLNGTGKSYLAACIKREVEGQGDVVVFVSVPDLGGRIRATWDREKGAPTEQEVFDAMVDADLLVLDDLGAEAPRPVTEEQLYRIIDGRYRNKRPMVVTANVSPQQFDARFGARIADRLAEVCDLLVLNAKSYRKILAERGM